MLATVGLGRLGLGSAKPNAPIKEIKVSRSAHPESAQHIDDAQAAGKPSVLTVDREGAAARRAASLKGRERAPSGQDRDEYRRPCSRKVAVGRQCEISIRVIIEVLGQLSVINSVVFRMVVKSR